MCCVKQVQWKLVHCAVSKRMTGTSWGAFIVCAHPQRRTLFFLFLVFKSSWILDSCGWLSACRCLRKRFLDSVGSTSRCWMVHGWDNTCWKDTCNQILIHSCTTHAELMYTCGTNLSTPCNSQLILIEVSHFTRDETCNWNSNRMIMMSMSFQLIMCQAVALQWPETHTHTHA